MRRLNLNETAIKNGDTNNFFTYDSLPELLKMHEMQEKCVEITRLSGNKILCEVKKPEIVDYYFIFAGLTIAYLLIRIGLDIKRIGFKQWTTNIREGVKYAWTSFKKLLEEAKNEEE